MTTNGDAPTAEALDRRVAFQITESMARNIDARAQAQMLTTSAWLRSVVLAVFERDGEALPRLAGHMKHRRETAAAA